MSDDDIKLDPRDRGEKRVLLIVLAVNVAQAIIVGAIGLYADSTGLLGVGLDNLADAGVYALSLYAVGRSLQVKVLAARVSGTFLMTLVGVPLVEVVGRFFTGADPFGLIMIASYSVATRQATTGRKAIVKEKM